VKISCTNKKVLKGVNTNLSFLKSTRKRKLEYAGHVLRGSSGTTHLVLLERKVCGKRSRGRPRLTSTYCVRVSTRLAAYETVNRTAGQK